MAVDRKEKEKVDGASSDPSEFDEALADFFDWSDRSRRDAPPQEVGPRDSQQIVSAFLRDCPQWSDNGLLAHQLANYLSQMAPIERTAADVTLQWLELGISADGSEELVFSVAAASLPRTFAGYELLERIGHGGMGVVYKAHQPSLGRIVCLKMLPPGFVEPDRVRRLADEARLAGTLQHPGIVTVFDAGESDGQPYYVMEFIRGETLGQRLAREKPSAQQAASLLEPIAAAVQHAHEHGVATDSPAIRLEEHEGDVRAIAFSPDSCLLATIDGNSDLRVFQLNTRRLLFKRELDSDAVHALCFLDPQHLFASNSSGNILRIVRNPVTDRVTISSWKAHQGPVWSLARFGDRILSAGQDGKLHVWDGDGELLATVANLPAAIWSITCNEPTDRVVVSTTAGSIHAWK